MSSAIQDEHVSGNEENIPPPPPQSSQASTSLVTPVLTQQIYMGSVAEDEMIDQINAVIRRLLTRPNHQSPYRYNFEWTVHEESNLNYSVVLMIREPSI